MKKPKHAGFDAPFFDDEEEAAIRAAERGELKSSGTKSRTVAAWQRAVRNTLRKKPITVRVQEQDIEYIKAKALEQGIPYQTLVASVLHQYARGKLREDA
jgi:predicted DNA binding CopG/RHH family protein